MKALSITLAVFVAGADLQAQDTTKPAKMDTAVKLTSVKVTAERPDEVRTTALIRNTLPLTASITARKVEETVNLIDTEDALKYMPSVFLRKRNNGDTQATMATRVWGTSSSARSLVFADGVPLSALVANNNTLGGPRWGLVAPAEVARVDMMMGPFSAAYGGGSMGAVVEITTRLPEKLEGSINQTQSLQTFSLYGTDKTLPTTQTTLNIGNKLGKFTFWASGNYQDSRSQPLSYVTSATFPNGTTGGYAEKNKLGAAANVLGAGGLLHTGMTNGKIKATYDITPKVRAAYTFGYWKNDASSSVEAFSSAGGQPTYAGQAGFASSFYDLVQEHHAQTFSVRSDFRKNWDFELAATQYSFDNDKQRTPTSASASGTTFGAPGRVAVLDGTGWHTLDAKATWRPFGPAHTISFGAHHDRYTLSNTTFNTPDWTNSDNRSGVFTEGDGKTQTQALWIQDAWWLTPSLKLTYGGRFENWKGFDGYNVNGSTTVHQPEVSGSKFSPKAVLAWTPTPEWTVTGSVGKAYRFATASELYQLVSTGMTFTSPNPDLKPDDVLATELRAERRFDRGSIQLSVFQDDVHDAIISQFLPLVPNSPTLYSYVSNVDHVRARGYELLLGTSHIPIRGLDLTGTITYVDAKTLAMTGRASATAAPDAAIGKQLPNIPEWRLAFTSTYRPSDAFTFNLAGRYSSKLYTTLDNADVNYNTYQGFSEWFVMDTRANYRVNRHWSTGVGVDNLLNRKYFLFHPFPQRTYVANLKYAF
ncbi:MAG TPA: TonB-dependent receptor [Gemmatimonadaceae bacterium]